jgi:hypothetical protein
MFFFTTTTTTTTTAAATTTFSFVVFWYQELSQGRAPPSLLGEKARGRAAHACARVYVFLRVCTCVFLVARMRIKGSSHDVCPSHLRKRLQSTSTSPTTMPQFVNQAELLHIAQNVEAVICDYSPYSNLSEVRNGQRV